MSRENCTTASTCSELTSVRWQAQTGEDTEEFGGRLARAYPGGDRLAVVYLVGELGAGKTTLARGFLRAYGVEEPVRSPTYALLEMHEIQDRSVVHVDLFRLRDPSELAALGLREWARPGFVWLVEWPERGAGQLPDPDLTVRLAAGESGHEINVIAGTPLGESWLRALRRTG